MTPRLRGFLGRGGLPSHASADEGPAAPAPDRTITSVAGYDDGDGLQAGGASLGLPLELAFDGGGNLYLTDYAYHLIRRIDAATGVVSTAVGNGIKGDGPGGMSPTETSIDWPFGAAFDSQGNLYFCDFGNHLIRFVNRTSQTLTVFNVTVAPQTAAIIGGDGYKDQYGSGRFTGDDGPALDASLNYPRGIALDAAGNVYFDDIDNVRVRRIDRATGIITTVAGDGSLRPRHSGDGGPATEASLLFPTSVAFDPAGNLYIGEYLSRIRKVDVTGIITTVAGRASEIGGFSGDGGPATKAEVSQQQRALTFDASGNLLFADQGNNRIRRIDASTGIITTVAGDGELDALGEPRYSPLDSGGPPVAATLTGPTGLAFFGTRLYETDAFSGIVRVIDPGADGLVNADPSETISDIPGSAGLRLPGVATIDRSGGIFVTEDGRSRISMVDPSGAITTIAGTGVPTDSIDGQGGDPRDDLGDGGRAIDATVGHPTDLGFDQAGNLYFTDITTDRVRRIHSVADPVTHRPTVGPGSRVDTVGDLGFAGVGIAVADRRDIYVSGLLNNQVWRLDGVTGVLTLIAGTGEAGYSGDGGQATDATLNGPSGMALDATHSSLYIADFSNLAVRKVDLRTGIISTVVTLSGAFDYAQPVSVAVVGDLLFVVDLFNGTVSRVDLTDQAPAPTVVAGTGYDFAPGFTGDHVAATTAELSFPVGVTTDGSGKVYVVENRGQRIRRLGLVDIAPRRFPNRVDLSSHRRIVVGILSTYGFDAVQIDPSTLTVAGAPATLNGIKDLNRDGRPDLLIDVRADELQLSSSDIEAPIDGVTFAGDPFHDADWVTVVAPPSRGSAA